MDMESDAVESDCWREALPPENVKNESCSGLPEVLPPFSSSLSVVEYIYRLPEADGREL